MSAGAVAARVLALGLAVALPGAAFAAIERGGGGRPPAQPSRAAAPPPPAAPRLPAAPPPRAPGGSGFNFNRDVGAQPQRPVVVPQQQRPAYVPQQRPAVVPQQQRPAYVPQRPSGQQRTAPTYRQAPFTAGNGPRTGRFHGPVVANPQHWNGSWGWNRGVAWRPAPTYWGGGFWGPWSIGALAGATLFGVIFDASTQTQYPSYEVEPDSPGAQLLQNYGLQQTPCGPPGLVMIWGPDNSVICAFPNTNVAPGDYQLDPTTLNLVSGSP